MILMQGKIFKTSHEFCIYIDNIVSNTGMNHMEAVLEYCKQNYIDPEDISKMVNKQLKEKIAVNMIEENYLPKRATLDV
jgi:hypothetical protein